MKNKIIDLLESGINNEKFDAVNRGGCGVFAVAMHNALAAYGIHSEIVLVNQSYCEDNVTDMIEKIGAENINHAYTLMINDKDNKYSTCCGHVCISIDGVLYDGEGVHEGRAISEPIHVSVMDKLNKLEQYWNITFRLFNNNFCNNNNNPLIRIKLLIREVNNHVKEELYKALMV